MFFNHRSPTHTAEHTLLSAHLSSPNPDPDSAAARTDAERTDANHNFIERTLPVIATLFDQGQRNLFAHIIRRGGRRLYADPDYWTGPTLDEMLDSAGSLSPASCTALESLRRYQASTTQPRPDLAAVELAVDTLVSHYTYNPETNPYGHLHFTSDGKLISNGPRLSGPATQRLAWLQLYHTHGYTGLPRLAYETGTDARVLRPILLALESHGIVERFFDEGTMFVRIAERHSKRTQNLLATYQETLEHGGERWTLHPNPMQIDVDLSDRFRCVALEPNAPAPVLAAYEGLCLDEVAR